MKNLFMALRGDKGYSPKEQCLHKPTPTLRAICAPVAPAFYKATWYFLSPCTNGTAISAAQILSSIFVLPSKTRKLLGSNCVCPGVKKKEKKAKKHFPIVLTAAA